MRKILFVCSLFAAILLVGAVGYVVLENTTFWDGLYLTVITIATVGYGDMVPIYPGGKIFTVFLVFSGAGLVMYSFGKITEAMVEGGLRKVLERRKMDRKIAGIENHYIICGFGRIGKEIAQMLHEEGKPFIVVERDPGELKAIEELGYIALAGEASDDEVLLRAGIDRAKGLIAVVSTDADNLYITLTARGINPKLFILARSSGEKSTRTKLLRAGASKVISPYSIGARRMASMVLRPTVTDFVDLAMYASDIGLRLEEIQISPRAVFVNKPLMDSGLRKQYDLIVVAIKREEGEMLFNPGPETIIRNGDLLIVLGKHDQLAALQKAA